MTTVEVTLEIGLETEVCEDFIFMEKAPKRAFPWLKSGYYHPFSIAKSVLRFTYHINKHSM